ncbi:unnamed protein product [Phytomonas sp. Hart1]|nr:unnamed protein product [Phytomonas sp. Hart1]|eukprot:CCW67771.1 unnamed protein product [Phytomonas sp. isolate Hart1]
MFSSGCSKLDGFSSKNKIQRHHGDGTQTIICMGRPFRVERRITSTNSGCGRRRSKNRNDGNSFVYLVENSSRLSEFPIYLVLKRVFYSVSQITDAHKEIGILSSIKDKNIVRVFHNEISRSEGKISVTIAMEYCENNLARRISSGTNNGAGTRLSEAEICHILFAITSALGYLHSLQPPIAHRNITPGNILINNNLTGPLAYMLTNFESATTEAYECANRAEAAMALEDIESHTNVTFRSPEMADPWSKRRISQKSDMWMVGVLLYYLIYLKLPFEGTNMALSRDPKPYFPTTMGATAYTGSLRTIMTHLLEANPEDRWDVFALTNFLRFDEDLNRHLGTFCFTRTEYPEGWEEQEVKVVDRPALAKRPSRAYDEAGGPTAGEPTLPPSEFDDAVQEVMLVMGDQTAGANLSSEDREEYRKMIIKEQEEAWERAKGAAPSPAPETSATDDFDDLFVGPVEKGLGNPQAPAPRPPPVHPSSVSKPIDPFGSDGIFSAPPPLPQVVDSLFSQPQTVWGNMSDNHPVNNNHNGGGYGYYNIAAQPQGVQNLTNQEKQKEENGTDYNNTPALGGFDAFDGEFYPPPQPAYPRSASPAMPQISIDFLSLPSDQYHQQQQPMDKTSKEPNNSTQKVKKDPFADLLL